MIKYSTRDIIKRAEQLADLENSSFISQEEKLSLLNEGFQFIYQKIINSNDKTWVKNIRVESGMELPIDFYQLSNIFVEKTNTPINRINSTDTEGYSISNNKIYLSKEYLNVPVIVEYIPVPPTLFLNDEPIENPFEGHKPLAVYDTLYAYIEDDVLYVSNYITKETRRILGIGDTVDDFEVSRIDWAVLSYNAVGLSIAGGNSLWNYIFSFDTDTGYKYNKSSFFCKKKNKLGLCKSNEYNKKIFLDFESNPPREILLNYENFDPYSYIINTAEKYMIYLNDDNFYAVQFGVYSFNGENNYDYSIETDWIYDSNKNEYITVPCKNPNFNIPKYTDIVFEGSYGDPGITKYISREELTEIVGEIHLGTRFSTFDTDNHFCIWEIRVELDHETQIIKLVSVGHITGTEVLKVLPANSILHINGLDTTREIIEASPIGLLNLNKCYLKKSSFTNTISIQDIKDEEEILNYPNNIYWTLLSYKLAIAFKTKQSADVTQLTNLYNEAEAQFFDSISRDCNTSYRINNVNKIRRMF